MDVLMLTNTYKPFVGGVPESVGSYVRLFRERGHDVRVVAPTYSDQASSQPSHVVRVPALHDVSDSSLSVSLPSPGYVDSRLGEFEPDVVHAHHPFLLGMKALRLAGNFDVPLVFTHHTRYEQYTHNLPVDGEPVQEYARAQAGGYADRCEAVIAPSESIRKDLREQDVESPIRVIPTGVDRTKFSEGDGERIRNEHGISSTDPVVGYVGRLSAEKNLDLLIDALGDHLKKHEDVQGLIVGDGPSKDRLKKRVRRRGLDQRVHFTGALRGDDLVDAYHAMDLFAFASLSETQGMVLTEAMAAGVPVVALDGSGVRDVVSDGKNGRLLQERSARALTEGLDWFQRCSDSRRRQLSEGARRTARHYSLTNTADRTMDLYRSVVRKYRMNRRSWKRLKPLRRVGAEMKAAFSQVRGLTTMARNVV